MANRPRATVSSYYSTLALETCDVTETASSAIDCNLEASGGVACFTYRELGPGSEDETEVRSLHHVPVDSVGEHTPVLSERDDDNVQSLASDHGDHDPKTPERSKGRLRDRLKLAMMR
ncbi:hypothetical protein PInf_007989 [Phytophthora infestans]|nr:hypothetical protein PInf_007989 [Phytophthora infestans]